MLLGWFKDINDTADGICSTHGMQAGENKMACLSCSHNGLDGFMVAHFPQKDHVRTLAKRCTKGREVIVRIGRNLALADNALFVAVQEFKRILQCDDVVLSG